MPIEQADQDIDFCPFTLCDVTYGAGVGLFFMCNFYLCPCVEPAHHSESVGTCVAWLRWDAVRLGLGIGKKVFGLIQLCGKGKA